MKKYSSSSVVLKSLILCLVGLCLSCSTNGKGEQGSANSWSITVSGKVGYPQSGTIVIQELRQDGVEGWKDTVTLKPDYTFSKQLTLNQPGYYRMNFYNKQIVTLILHKSDIEVNVDGNSQQGFTEIKGSPDIDLINRVQQIQAAVNEDPEVLSLNERFTVAAQRRDEVTMDKLRMEYQSIAKKYNDQIASLLVEKSPSLAVINLLQNNTLDRDAYYDVYVKVADKLRKEWSDYSFAKDFVTFVDRMKLTAVGELAPEISLPNPDGEIVSLSSLRGKYVLVDFWAKWCGPCRQENPNIVRAYQKYKDDGFTVYGVSLDRNRQDWLQGIEQDNLTWTHVSDLKYWQSEAAKTYNITAIPFSLLLDPDGRIIAKNLRGQALHQKLAEVFGK